MHPLPRNSPALHTATRHPKCKKLKLSADLDQFETKHSSFAVLIKSDITHRLKPIILIHSGQKNNGQLYKYTLPFKIIGNDEVNTVTSERCQAVVVNNYSNTNQMGDKAMLWNHNDFYAPERPFMHLTVCC
jgi:hypothetical protein